MKLIILLIYLFIACFDFFINRLSSMWTSMPLPDNVKDIYDKERYNTFLSYKKAKSKISLVTLFFDTLLGVILLIYDCYAKVALLYDNVYLQIIMMTIIFSLIQYPIHLIINIIDTFVIEQKYGFNKTSVKTFITDEIKSILIGFVLAIGLQCGLAFLVIKFSIKGLIISFIILLILIILLNLFATQFMMIFNKFTILEDGDLKESLEELCLQYDVTLKGIYVINESLRSNHLNAFCTGLGNKKKIVLYDNLIETMSTQQIVAIFAHELAHAKFHHSYYLLAASVGNIVIMFCGLVFLIKNPLFFNDFGFNGINYYFIYIILSTLIWPLSEVYEIFVNWLTRQCEYQADNFATKLGYGDDLKEALKILCYHDLANLNPCPLIVTLKYNHPTLSQRLSAIDKEQKNK